MSLLKHLTVTEILELWSLGCRSTRQAIIQHQKTGCPVDHRLAVGSIWLLDHFKEQILTLIPEEQATVEWDYATVLHLYKLLQPARFTGNPDENAPDAFQALVKTIMKEEAARISQSLR